MPFTLPKLPRFSELRGSIQYTVYCHNMMASLALQELLETKHLYQKVSIDPTEIIKAVTTATYYPQDKEAYAEWVKAISQHLDLRPTTKQRHDDDKNRGLLSVLIMENLKLYCANCEEREAFAPVWFSDSFNTLTRGGIDAYPTDFAAGKVLSMLVIHYQCQICKTQPVVFLIERDGWELKLHGRSPMETVKVPQYIPKVESRLYSDAIIAFNSGKTLAGLFYLRSFLELFARRVTGITERIPGDVLMGKYSEGLPSPQRDFMPSLRDLYDKLSTPIHAATDDIEVFTSAKENIDKHFDFRRIYNIQEKPAAKIPT
jgi:hypothetical protein